MNKNILVIIPSLTLGGAEKQALWYARIIKSLGIGNVKIIGIGREGELIDRLIHYKIDYETFRITQFTGTKKINKLTEIIKFALFLRKQKPDIVISFTLYPNILTGITYRYSGAKKCFWNQRSLDEQIPVSFFEKIAKKNKLSYISNSSTTKDFILARHRLKPETITIVPNVVESFTESNKCQMSNVVFKMVMVANFYPEKDYTTVIKAIKTLVSTFPSKKIELYIIGKAPGASPALYQAKSLAFDLKLQDNVFFLPNDTDVTEVLTNVNVGIISSLSEGCSNSLLEYLSAGLPVAASDIPANREVIKDSRQLFKPGSVESLVELLKFFINHKNLTEIGVENKKTINSNYSEDNVRSILKKLLS